MNMKRLILSVLPMLAFFAGCARHHAKVEAPTATVQDYYPYRKPLSTPGTRFGSLPQNVQTTVLSEAGTVEISDVGRENIAGRVIYKIYFKDAADYPPLFVGSDGSVLNPDLTVAVAAPPGPTTIKFDDLPLSVTRAIREKAPEAEVGDIKLEYWGDHTIYVVSFKDDRHFPKLCVAADGNVLTMARPVAP